MSWTTPPPNAGDSNSTEVCICEGNELAAIDVPSPAGTEVIKLVGTEVSAAISWEEVGCGVIADVSVRDVVGKPLFSPIIDPAPVGADVLDLEGPEVRFSVVIEKVGC